MVAGALPHPRSMMATAADTRAEAVALRSSITRLERLDRLCRERAAAAVTSTMAFGLPPGLPLCPGLNFRPRFGLPFSNFAMTSPC